jgi:xanthine dehydrogenase small subunit
MTVWFLAMNASITLSSESGSERRIKLRDLYKGYKKLAKTDDEYITGIRFTKPLGDFRFNFEKVSKRTFLDISTVNTAIAMRIDTAPGPGWVPPALAGGSASAAPPADGPPVTYTITGANVAAGGVAPIPLYLKKTSAFLKGKEVNAETIAAANEIMQSEISPISDVRGSESYKRLLLRQLFRAHFGELFDVNF